jgi:hypothetical protein
LPTVWNATIDMTKGLDIYATRLYATPSNGIVASGIR